MSKSANRPGTSFDSLEKSLRGYVAGAKPKPDTTARGQIKRLFPIIEDGLNRGFTLEELYEVLSKNGFERSFSSFKQYLRPELQKRGQNSKRATKQK